MDQLADKLLGRPVNEHANSISRWWISMCQVAVRYFLDAIRKLAHSCRRSRLEVTYAAASALGVLIIVIALTKLLPTNQPDVAVMSKMPTLTAPNIPLGTHRCGITSSAYPA